MSKVVVTSGVVCSMGCRKQQPGAAGDDCSAR